MTMLKVLTLFVGLGMGVLIIAAARSKAKHQSITRLEALRGLLHEDVS